MCLFGQFLLGRWSHKSLEHRVKARQTTVCDSVATVLLQPGYRQMIDAPRCVVTSRPLNVCRHKVAAVQPRVVLHWILDELRIHHPCSEHVGRDTTGMDQLRVADPAWKGTKTRHPADTYDCGRCRPTQHESSRHFSLLFSHSQLQVNHERLNECKLLIAPYPQRQH